MFEFDRHFIPYYCMQYSKIPNYICDEIKKIQRGFV